MNVKVPIDVQSRDTTHCEIGLKAALKRNNNYALDKGNVWEGRLWREIVNEVGVSIPPSRVAMYVG